MLYVNGDPLTEPYVPSEYEDLSDFGPMRVPSDSYFVMGDNRSSSNDSRVFGRSPAGLFMDERRSRFGP